jgi:hypothetical protein
MAMSRRSLPLILALAAILLPPALGAAPAMAQTADDLFRDDQVGQIRLLMNSRDWQTLKDTYRENTYYPADLHWNGVVVRNIGIRSRGLGSRNQFKPGLRLDFNRYSTGQKFLGLKSLVLDNLTQDPGMMREHLTFAFFARMGLPAPRGAYVGLFVNEEFIGVYRVVESIDRDYLQRTLQDDDGYLYEFNNVSGWWFDDRWEGDLETYSKLFSAKTHEDESKGTLFGHIDEMIHAANVSGDFVGGVGRLLDLDAFAQYLAAETFMAERDGMLGYDGANNFYYYRSVTTGLAQFLVWDKDLAASDIDYSVWTNLDRNVLARRTLRDPVLHERYLTALERAVALATAPPEPPPGESATSEGPALGWFEREARRIGELISPSVHLDGAKPFSNERFDEDVAWMIEFARHRPAFVASEVQRDRERK